MIAQPWRCSSAMGGHRCQKVRYHGGRHSWRRGRVGHFWSTAATMRETYETAAPWITWTWLSDDRETRVTGRMRMRLTCCVCGRSETVRVRIPRWGPVPTPEGGVHPERHRAMERHAHTGQRDPRDWALPLRNMAAWGGGLPLDVFQNVAETAVMEQAIDDSDDQP